MTDHNALIRQEFARQAEHFEAAGLTLTSAEYLQWMVRSLPLSGQARVLDVATGTALLARAIAPQVREVVAIDTTPEMLRVAGRAIAEAGLGNIVLQTGLAEQLPYAEDSFDLVVSRLAVHHFAHPERPLQEMRRVCRRGGIVAVIDLLSPDEAGLIDTYNRLERRRDPSHTRALTRGEMRRTMAGTGLRLTLEDYREIAVEVNRWLAMTGAGEAAAAEVRNALEGELRGDGETGMRPFLREDALMFRQRWGIFVGEK